MGNVKHKIGDRVVWKDRPGRTRVMEYTINGMEEARRVNYLKYHPEEEIKNYRILQLDMDPFNFDEDNLVKVTVKEMNLLNNNNILAKTENYEFNKKQNIKALTVIRNELLIKQLKEEIENGK